MSPPGSGMDPVDECEWPVECQCEPGPRFHAPVYGRVEMVPASLARDLLAQRDQARNELAEERLEHEALKAWIRSQAHHYAEEEPDISKVLRSLVSEGALPARSVNTKEEEGGDDE